MAEKKTKIDIFLRLPRRRQDHPYQKAHQRSLRREQIVLIENEFGEIGIDGGFMREPAFRSMS